MTMFVKSSYFIEKAPIDIVRDLLLQISSTVQNCNHNILMFTNKSNEYLYL